MFEQVVVWLDPLAPSQGAFAHAVEWASRLRLPLRGVAFASQRLAGSLPDSCAEACDRRGIPWTASVWDDSRRSRLPEFLGSGRLDVFGRSVAPGVRRRSAGSPPLAALVCPDHWLPLKRVLLLHQTRDPANTFLTRAAQLCHAFRVTLVVLTVARSEPEAQRRQRFAEETLAAQELSVKFDFIVGSDLRAAAALDARWRNCTHVWVEQAEASPWRRWLRGDPLQRLLGLSDSLACVAFSPTAGDFLPARTDLPPAPVRAPARTFALMHHV